MRRTPQDQDRAEARGKGKRGGARVIYLNIPEAERIDLITVYGKDGRTT